MAYATAADLDALALPPDVRDRATQAEKDAALAAASALADSYLAAAGYQTPLTTWGDDLRDAVCALAAYDLAVQTGMAPEGGESSNLYLRRSGAIRWLEQVATGRVRVSGTSTDTGSLGTPLVRSDEPRGW